MTRIVGSAPRAILLELARRGLSSEQATLAIEAEAKRRYPDAHAVIFTRAATHDGIDVLVI